MKTVIMSREREVGRVRRALERLHSLRLQMMLIVALTAATGFLTSALLELAAVVVAAFWIVWIAPTLFAELTLDAALATGLYKRLKKIEGDHWLRTAIRRTIWPFVGVAVLFTAAGAAMHAYAPQAKSIGQVIEQMKAD